MSYIDGFLIPVKAGNKEAYREMASKSAVFLKEFGATRVVLFGSLVRGEAGPGSDIDLLVDGISPSLWFDACGAAMDAAPLAEVDMVPWDHCRAHVKARALAEGVALHG